MPNSNCIVIIINTVERMRGNAVLLIVADPGGDDPDFTGEKPDPDQTQEKNPDPSMNTCSLINTESLFLKDFSDLKCSD